MIKAKKTKLLLNLGIATTLTTAAVLTTALIVSKGEKSKDLAVNVNSRAVDNTLYKDEVYLEDAHASNKDNNLTIKEKKEIQPVNNTPEEPKEEPVKKEDKIFADAPENKPEPEVKEEKPKEELSPAPVEPKEPEKQPDPEKEPEPAPKPEPQPEPKEEPKKPKIEDLLPTANEGSRINPDKLPDLDFAKLKQSETGGTLTAAQQREIKNAIKEVTTIIRTNTGKWTAADRAKIKETFKTLRSYSYWEKDLEFNEEFFDSYLDVFDNDGKSAEEIYKKWPSLNRGDKNANFPYFFKQMFLGIEKELDAQLAKGFIPNLDYGSFNMGVSWQHSDLSKNTIHTHYVENNKKRYFAYDSPWARNEKAISNLEYENFRKNDVTSTYTSEGASAADGITVLNYTPTGKLVEGQENKIIAVLDASNPRGYANFLFFLKSIERNKRKLDGVVIKKMGLVNKKQDFKHILSQLPDSVEKLTLFFEGRDTSSLIALKDKHIKELELYTEKGGTLNKEWSLNPVALKNVDNVAFDYVRGQNFAGSIVFNRFKFDSTDTLESINEGFKIAFDTKSDQRIFQGEFGDGSWPTKLDFSNVPSIRSLRGINLYGRVFKELTLYSDSNVFTIDVPTLTEQQWSALLVKGPERPKLYFEGPVAVDTLYFKGNAVDLKNNYGQQLYGLIESGNYNFRTIYVDNQVMADTLNKSQAFTKFGKRAVVKPADFNPEGRQSELSFN